MAMGDDELRAFLAQPRIGTLATNRADGFPHIVPVWYRYDGRAVTIWTEESRGWVRNVVRDPRVAFSVQQEQPPFAAVLMRGRAMVVTEESEAVLDEVRQITRIYIPEGEVEPYVGRWWPRLKTIVTITPEVVRSWSIGY